jgi:hypothetical protein
MKPDNLPTEPLDQNDLQKLPRNTMAKSMRSLEELISIHEKGGDMSLEEARLLDRHIFEKTGEHLPEFAQAPVVELPQADYVVGKSRNKPILPEKAELTFGSKIPVADSVILPGALPDAIPSKSPVKPSQSVS